MSLSRFQVVLVLLGPMLLASCSGGGSGSAGPAGTAGVFLTDVQYGRLYTEDGVTRVVSPLTTVQKDPILGSDVPGSLEVLDASVDPKELVTLGLGPSYLPRVVPRNGVLVLTFNGTVDPGSVIPDTLAADGTVLQPGNVQVRFQKRKGHPAQGVRAQITVKGKQLWVNPVLEDQLGFPPSPVDFDASGNPRADATGYLRLILGAISRPLTSGGRPLNARPDGLGTVDSPIGFNPGNSVLDFINQDNLIPTTESFNGFLPDRSPPRLIRQYTHEDTYLPAGGDSFDPGSYTDGDGVFSVAANGGQGEWAGKQLVLRPGKASEEKHFISHNDSDTVFLVDTFAQAPKKGDRIDLIRAELYEPDPQNPIDPATYDPHNPQNQANTLLVNFITAREIDAQAEPVGDPLNIGDILPAFCQLEVRFNEAIDPTSVLQWETFRVAVNPDPGLGALEKVSRIVLNARQDTAVIQPVREDPTTGTFEVVGWGPDVQSLQLILSTNPTTTFLQSNMTSSDLLAFLDLGHRSLRDLGGQPLGFPLSQFDPADPVIRYSEPFFTDEAVSSQIPPPASPDFQMIVHRFQGRPVTGIDPATGDPGVGYRDQTNYYLPIADVNLAVNGYLAGQPVVFIRKVHDDYFPPPDGQFGAFPQGVGYPLISDPAGAIPPFKYNGGRFQHVFRDVDASPGRDGLKGTLLDLYQVAFCPIGGNVTADTYEDISVHASHCYGRPSTLQNGAGAVNPNSGLNNLFDFPTYWEIEACNIQGACPNTNTRQFPNVYDKGRIAVVPPGTTWKLAQANIFIPPSDARGYHPWPAFTTRFQYNNGDYPADHRAQREMVNTKSEQTRGKKVWVGRGSDGGDSLLLEYRLRPQTTPVSFQNGFTFAVGILIAREPYFRSYSTGQEGNPLDPDDVAGEQRARCATPDTANAGNPNFYGDNARYFSVFDYVKTTSKITSPYVRAGTATAPDYHPAMVFPPLDEAPPGTHAKLFFQGSNSVKGTSGSGFSEDIDVADGYLHIGFRAVLVGNVDTQILPNFDVIAIPVRIQ